MVSLCPEYFTSHSRDRTPEMHLGPRSKDASAELSPQKDRLLGGTHISNRAGKMQSDDQVQGKRQYRAVQTRKKTFPKGQKVVTRR